MPKFFVIDKDGKQHTRDTRASGRVYTHAIVFHWPEVPPEGDYRGRKAGSAANWSSSLALAQRAGRAGYHGRTGYDIEILEAQVVAPKAPASPKGGA